VWELLVLYGALTGRDGIGGASVLASQDLEGSDEKRPSVQIGDPFRGKALIEVSLDLVERDLVLGLQDCGAAGLASSLAEMARGDAGVDVHPTACPRGGLEPWEIASRVAGGGWSPSSARALRRRRAAGHAGPPHRDRG
jgi:phosphoribosylformylglycinamidine synthase